MWVYCGPFHVAFWLSQWIKRLTAWCCLQGWWWAIS